MSHPFDATLKDIYGQDAADLAPVLHLPSDLPSRALNVDLSTVSAATDVAFGFGEPLKEIADINFQSGLDAHVDARLHLYNAAFYHHYHVPVRSILILLRPAADHSRLSGQLTYTVGNKRVEFQYELIRLWEQRLSPFLTGGPTLLPLAPLCQLPEDIPPEQALREIVQQIDQRLVAEVPYGQAIKLMTATFILTGLRVKNKTLTEIFQGVKIMHESSAFTVYEEKGRIEESHRLLLRQGRHRFGPSDTETERTLNAIQDLDRLERLADAVLTATSWTEFLATN